MPENKEQEVRPGRKQYLVAPRRVAGVQPLNAQMFQGVRGVLESLGCEIVSVKSPRSMFTPTGAEAAAAPATSVYVTRIDDEQLMKLNATKPPNLIIEEDAHLDYGGSPVGIMRSTAGTPTRVRDQKALRMTEVRIRVIGEDSSPVPNAKVILEGGAFPVEGTTDAGGNLTLSMVPSGGQLARSIFVDAQSEFWTYYAQSPALVADQVNVVRLRSLKSTLRGFPTDFRFGWGQTLMGLDQLSDDFTGRDVKVAIIDSGADNTHPLLRHVQRGQDFTDDATGSSWSKDVVGHGSHCAGIITARGTAGMAFRGFAPEAEIHVLRIFPGGRFSSLLDALDYCIDNKIDIVNMSLGSPQLSEVVEQKIAEVTAAGVACIVAAGNSGGPVQYPGASPNVFTVSALGKLGEFPPLSWEAQQLSQSILSPEGFFSPAFTCFGPQVNACAPGVAIISTVPSSTFEPQSGTSMAAPHVTGMAALVLAHTPSLRSIPRGAARVQQLFEVLRSASSPLNLGPGRTGFGLPTLHPLIPVMKAAARQAAVGRGASFEAQAASSTLSPEIVNQLGSVISDALIRAFAAAPTRAAPPVPDSPGADSTERMPPEQRAKS